MSIFDFTEHTYVEAVWFLAWHGTDWMAVVMREGDGPWQATYRFRYYANDDPFSRDDVKNTYELTLDASEAAHQQLIAAFDRLATLTAKAMHADTNSKIVVQGNAERALTLLSRQPWCHIKIVRDDADGGTVH